MQRIAIIGLGRFGTEIARRLGRSKVQVIAVDRLPQLVNEVKDDVEIAVRLDATDEQALRSQEIDRCDVCVVAIGESFEAALLTTVIAKKLGIPRVICRAQTAFHAEIFRQIGADEVIQPESEAGYHLAQRLVSPHIRDLMELSEGFTLLELEAPGALCGRTLKQLDLRAKYHINLIAIKRPTTVPASHGRTTTREEVISVPRPDDLILPGDLLVVVGSNTDLAKLPKE